MIKKKKWQPTHQLLKNYGVFKIFSFYIQYDGLKKQYKINIIILYQLPFILNFCLVHEIPFPASLTDS